MGLPLVRTLCRVSLVMAWQWYRLTFGMLITQSAFSHIRELDGTFGARIHEPVAALWVKFRCCDNFC